MALIQGPLDKLCKDYQTPHQKLPETVSHDAINLENFEQIHELPRYLLHDCVGLLELVERFSAETFELTQHTITERNKGEVRCKNALEHLLGGEWKKARPPWLKTPDGARLELIRRVAARAGRQAVGASPLEGRDGGYRGESEQVAQLEGEGEAGRAARA